MTRGVEIVAVGARTALGLQAASSAVACRAGISGVREHPFMIDQSGEPMPGALDSSLDPVLQGPERYLALAEAALREACGPLNRSSEALRVPIFLALPEIRPGFTPSDVAAIRDGLAKFPGLPVSVSEVHVSTQGHAAGLSVLASAGERMEQADCEICLVGGVESYFQADTMEWLDANRQLVGDISRSGFVPGEGSGFCLLMTERARKRHRLPALARLLSVGVGRETKLIKTQDLCLGIGLTAAVRGVVGGLANGRETVSAVICDINGERYRGEEWGFVCLRLSEYFEDPTAYWSPAECWGDVGAASGPLFAMLACQAAAGGYATGPLTLLWASSESGLRAAAILDTADLQ